MKKSGKEIQMEATRGNRRHDLARLELDPSCELSSTAESHDESEYEGARRLLEMNEKQIPQVIGKNGEGKQEIGLGKADRYPRERPKGPVSAVRAAVTPLQREAWENAAKRE